MLKRSRTVLFWIHLAAGASAGIVILVMSFTGAVLALRPQIQNWVDRDVRRVVPAGDRLGAFELFSAIKSARPDATPQSLALDRDPAIAATVGLGREGNVYVNPYTGEILGAPSQRVAGIFQTMTSWHRYMGATGEYRTTGRAATGASNLAFLILGLTGLVLWWPKQFTSQYLRPILWFKKTPQTRARHFNWHNTIGFWCLPAIIIMTLSGVVLSYSWGNTLVYRITGSPLPAGRGAGPGPGAQALEGRGRGGAGRGFEGRGGSEQGRGRQGRGGAAPGAAEGESRPSQPPQPSSQGTPEPGGPGGNSFFVPDSLNALFARAEQQVPTWGQLSLRLPARADGPISFTLTDGAQWNAFARSQLTLNSANGDVLQWQPYEQQNLGQKTRGWLRFAHTGELGGLSGQLIAGVGCLGGVFLVYTGLSLAIRRLLNWKLWARLQLNGVRDVEKEVQELTRTASRAERP